MRVLRFVLTVAALILPAAHRARWREESLAVLADVHGTRRWWFALDTIIKAPMLARQFRTPVPAPGRWVSVLTGTALIGASVAMVAAVLLTDLLGEDAAEFLFAMTPCGLIGIVAARSFHSARSYGGGPVPYLLATLITVFAGTGPLAAGLLAVATGVPAIALVGAVLPGLWLIAVSVAALVRRTSPPTLALIGTLCGVGLIGLLLGVFLVSYLPELRGPASVLTVLSIVLLMPGWTVWSTWTGARLIRARAPQRLV